MVKSTYVPGFEIKSVKRISKKDIITFCNLLNDREEYYNLCTFKPEPISNGGIEYIFKDKSLGWYKTVRLNVASWPWITENVIDEWSGSNDLILPANIVCCTFLKSFHGAPVFTIDELKLWEECFNYIGIQKYGKYPGKKSLICEME
jgi:hypothetical protein